MSCFHTIILPVVAFFTAGCLLNGDVPVPDADPDLSQLPDLVTPPDTVSSEDSTNGDIGSQADLEPFQLDLTCPNGAKPDLTKTPNCGKLIDRVLKECCPNPKPTLNNGLSGMVCTPNPDAMCKMILDSKLSFDSACNSFKTSSDCQ